MKPLVLYHANCADGFCAAWVAHKAMPDAEFIAVNYGEPPPDVKGRKVYILDFSYKRAVMKELFVKADSVTCLDHHKTAAADLENICEGRQISRAWCVFDMAHSGGRLTWDFFFPCQPVPWLVDYTEDRDLWTWKLPSSKEVSAALASYERTFERWDSFAKELPPDMKADPPNPLIPEGAAILRYQQQTVDSQAKNAVGHKVLSVNATTLISEIGEKLAQGRPFSATFFINAAGKKVWSLRSRDGGIDVSEIAKRHGGGGHKQAAGFTE